MSLAPEEQAERRTFQAPRYFRAAAELAGLLVIPVLGALEEPLQLTLRILETGRVDKPAAQDQEVLAVKEEILGGELREVLVALEVLR